MANDPNAGLQSVHTPDSFARSLISQVLAATPEKLKKTNGDRAEFNARVSVARAGAKPSTTESITGCICVRVDGWEVCACVEI
ncbi:hypothetical protein [Streptomyces sp. NPDC021212]|uniref:hypothetical protein n=1 Tax=Streptomyces sp. NPDC021212 TaxID=3365118 RepID=UPI0037BD72B0